MGKTVRGFLLMWEETHESWTIPTSEQAYRAYGHAVDVVLPTHGGILIPDTGNWTRHSSISSDFSSYLLATARRTGQPYIPSNIPYGSGKQADFLTLLTQPANWQNVADGLVDLALTSFDSPWDAVLYDWPDVPLGSVVAQEQFVTVLSQTVRAAGLPFGAAFRGIVSGDESWSPSLDVLRDITDWFDYYMYIYWGSPYSPCPYWWCRASIENALAHGFQPDRIYLGIPIFAYYRQNSTTAFITQPQGMQEVQDNGATVTWIDTSAYGILRESYANLGGGAQMWFEDAGTVQYRLDLIDEYDLAGAMVFVLGCGSESIWRTIAEWKRLPMATNPYLYQHGSIFGGRP